MYTNKEKEDTEFLLRCCVFGIFALMAGMMALLMFAIIIGGAT